MSASITLLEVNLSVTAIVALPAGYAPAAKDAASRSVQLNDLVHRDQLTAGSAPAPAQIVSKDITIPAAGFVEIDLTDAPIVGAVDAEGEPADGEDMTGKRAMILYFCTCRADGNDNADPITIGPGPSNGYPIFGAGNEVDVPANARQVLDVRDSSLPLVAAGVKTFRCTGTEGDVGKLLIVLE